MPHSLEMVLVTGCAGYIGSMATRTLLDAGFAVRGYDCLTFGGRGLMHNWADPNFQFVKGDVRDASALRAALDGCRHVVHLAAVVGDPACGKAPELAEAVNLRASLSLIDMAEQADIEQFTFVSTCSNYGKMQTADGYVDERSELRPISLYAETKVAVETEVLARSDSPVAFTCLRFATVYGVSPRMRFDLTVNQFAMEMVVKRKLSVYGAQFWRPYLHVRDAARAIATVHTSPKEIVRSNVFNVGATGENYTKQMIVDVIDEEIPGGAVEYVSIDEDPRDYRVRCDKIERELGFTLSRSLRDGVREVAHLVSEGIIDDPMSPIYVN